MGILGGSFDPVHIGHLILAETALAHLGLEQLLLLPAGQPAHKRRRALAPITHRLAMLRLAVRGNPKLRVSRLEADRPGVTFTVRTLEAMAKAGSAELFFLMGEDSLREFDAWREPDRILELARLAVVPRATALPMRLRPAVRRRVVFVPMPLIEISSSEIRRRIRRRLGVRYWVPDAVLTYMDRHGLYRTGKSSPA